MLETGKKVTPWLAMTICLTIIAGCRSAPSGFRGEGVATSPHPWTHLNATRDSDDFRFVIVSDRHGGARAGIFESAVEKINLLRPEFVMSVGDLIGGTTTDEALVDTQWDEFDGLVRRLESPFFYVPGNHDISNEVMVKKWQQRTVMMV